MKCRFYIRMINKREETFIDPTWEQIYETLQMMDDKQVVYVSLKLEEKGELIFLGGQIINGVRMFDLTYLPSNRFFNIVCWIWEFISTILLFPDTGEWFSYDEIVKNLEHFYIKGKYKKIKLKI